MIERPTIYDVARLAGVSSSMASRILRGARKKEDALTIQVKQAAATLGYQPNRMAQSLRSTSSRVIGLVIPELRNPFFSTYVELLSRHALDNNYIVMSLVATESDILPVVQRLAEYRVRAVVSAVPEVTYAMKHVQWDGLLIAVSRQPQNSDTLYVGMDDFLAGKLLAEHLAEYGHQHVIVFAESSAIPSTQPRLDGIHAVLSPANVMVEIVNAPEAVTVSHVKAVVERAKATAIIGGTDAIALRLYSALGQIGLRIPMDISLASFDGTFAVEDFVPIPLTSVIQPIDRCVKIVMEWITQDVAHHDLNRITLIPPHLRLGQTTRSLAHSETINK
ncbi:MAG: LacI family DNA-binding transcriptional regulator [Firmicutes bacterium]|nr:LacI family DNA-binding transcriptional regulator [Bacillota bacterium]